MGQLIFNLDFFTGQQTYSLREAIRAEQVVLLFFHAQPNACKVHNKIQIAVASVNEAEVCAVFRRISESVSAVENIAENPHDIFTVEGKGTPTYA